MVSIDDLVRKHGRVKLYDDVCVEHIGFYAVESCACMGFIAYRDFEMIGAGSTVLDAMRSAGEGLRLEQPAALAVPADQEPITAGPGNYYGSLEVRCKDGTPEWCVENYSGHHWEPCPPIVYAALLAAARKVEP